jgi:hypothetical protein
VEIQNPAQIAKALLELANANLFQTFRHCFLQNFTLSNHLETLQKAFLQTENPDP